MENSFLLFLGPWLQSHIILWGPIAIWVTVFLFGENGALIAFAFSAQGFISPADALIFSFLGSFSADLFWYFIIVSTFRSWYERHFKKTLRASDTKRSFLSLADNHPYALLILLKFLVGVRLILTFYILTKKKLPFQAYFFCILLGNILFVAVLFPIGWLLGTGAKEALLIGQGLSSILTTLVIVGITSQALLYLIRRALLRFSKK